MTAAVGLGAGQHLCCSRVLKNAGVAYRRPVASRARPQEPALLVRNGGFENAASGDEWSSRRAAWVFQHPARAIAYENWANSARYLEVPQHAVVTYG